MFRCCTHSGTSSRRRSRRRRSEFYGAQAHVACRQQTSAARCEWSMVMTKGVVVIYFSRLGGRLDTHQKLVLEADARVIARVLGYDFGVHHETANDDPAPVFFVPDDTLLVDEASSLGIHRPNDFYGGVVPH